MKRKTFRYEPISDTHEAGPTLDIIALCPINAYFGPQWLVEPQGDWTATVKPLLTDCAVELMDTGTMGWNADCIICTWPNIPEHARDPYYAPRYYYLAQLRAH